MHHQLYIARRESRLHQIDVAEMLRINPQAYYLKECGKFDFSLREAKMLSEYIDVTLD